MGKGRHQATAAALVGVALVFVALVFVALTVDDEPTPQPAVAAPATMPSRATPPSTAEASNAVETPVEPVTPAVAEEPAEPVSQSQFRGVPEPETTPVQVEPLNEWERAFQDEQRDEAWARPLEAQIRQSLEPQVNLGRFYISNIECRTALCEVRLLAQGSLQGEELQSFDLESANLPWYSQLTMMLSSGVARGDGAEISYESIWIFERKPEAAPEE